MSQPGGAWRRYLSATQRATLLQSTDVKHAHAPVDAVLSIVGAVACFALVDAIIKFLTLEYPVPLLVWVRWLMQALFTAIWLSWSARWSLIRTSRLKLHLVRSLVLLN